MMLSKWSYKSLETDKEDELSNIEPFGPGATFYISLINIVIYAPSFYLVVFFKNLTFGETDFCCSFVSGTNNHSPPREGEWLFCEARKTLLAIQSSQCLFTIKRLINFLKKNIYFF